MHAWPDREIGALAARQRLLITFEQLITLGVGRSSLARAVARGRLHRVHQGVYSLVPVTALPPLAAEQAAVLACGPRALLSHRSALALWQLSPAPNGRVEVTVVHGSPYRNRAGIQVHQARVLDHRDVRRHQRLPVTAPARTLLDNAPRLSDRELELGLDQALASHLTSRTAIREMLQRYPNRPGAPRLRALLNADRGSSVTRSRAEERLLALVRRGGLPAPEANVELGAYRPDLLWRDQRVVVEFDSWAFHGGRGAFERDRRRDNDLAKAGFQVIRVTDRHLREEPAVVLVWIATAIARGERP